MTSPSEPNPYATPPTTDDWQLKAIPLDGNVLFQGWQLVSAYWVPLAAVVGIVYLPCEILSNFAEYELSSYEPFVFLGNMTIEFLAYPLSMGAVMAIIIAAASGHRLTIREAWSTSLSVFSRFAVTYAFGSIVIVLGMLLLILPGIYLMIVFSLVDSVVMKEGSWGLGVLRRSLRLAMRRFWPLAGINILLGLITLSPWILFAIVSELLGINIEWYLDTTIDLTIDLVAVYPAACLYLWYRRLVHREGHAETENEATSTNRANGPMVDEAIRDWD